MALLRDRTLFTSKWQRKLQSVAQSGMVASIQIYTRSVEYVNFQPTVTKTYVYTGKARVQPMRTSAKEPAPGDTSYVQQVLFSIPILSEHAALVPEDMFVDVTASPLNADLVGPVFQVREVLDSSNPLERTFIAEVDTSG